MASSLEVNQQDRMPAASLNYWRRLTHQNCPDSQPPQKTSRRWRGEWTGKC
jgi:hypothetical protein